MSDPEQQLSKARTWFGDARSYRARECLSRIGTHASTS